MKAVTDTLGVARSNVVERIKATRPKRGPQTREGDLELAAEIRRLVDQRPTYGYRCIAALIKTAGISGEMIRDLMVECVETRFHAPRAPHPVQWLADNGSVYAAGKTLEIAVALSLKPCFTPVESPESNGVAEAFVKTLKRDYVRINPLPDAATAITAIANWMDDYNEVHPHSRLAYRSPREYIRDQSQRAACPV